jgi:hypothetical protein
VNDEMREDSLLIPNDSSHLILNAFNLATIHAD